MRRSVAGDVCWERGVLTSWEEGQLEWLQVSVAAQAAKRI